MKKPTISESDFIKALRDQMHKAGVGAMTGAEIATAMGVPSTTAQLKVRRMVEGGILEYAGKVPRPKITGEYCHVPAYRMAGKAGRK